MKTRLACFVLALVFSGCSPQNAPPPSLVKVSGEVNLDGAPMAEGKVLFNVPGYASRTFEIKDGVFSGEAYIGKNRVDIVLEKDGPPASTGGTTKINTVARKAHEAEVTKDGPNSFSFEATSVR